MFRFPPLTPFVKKLLIGLFSLLVLEAVLELWMGFPVTHWIALRASEPGVHWVWQTFTHVAWMLPRGGGELGVLISLLFLWLMLGPFEQRFGPQRAAQLCVAAAVAAAAPAMLAGTILGQNALVGGPGPIAVAALCGYAATLPRQAEISLFGVFAMKPSGLIWLMVGFNMLGFLFSKNFVQLAADMGAIGGGVAFVRWMQRPPKKRIFRRDAQKRRGPPLRVVRDEDTNPKKWLN